MAFSRCEVFRDFLPLSIEGHMRVKNVLDRYRTHPISWYTMEWRSLRSMQGNAISIQASGDRTSAIYILLL